MTQKVSNELIRNSLCKIRDEAAHFQCSSYTCAFNESQTLLNLREASTWVECALRRLEDQVNSAVCRFQLYTNFHSQRDLKVSEHRNLLLLLDQHPMTIQK